MAAPLLGCSNVHHRMLSVAN